MRLARMFAYGTLGGGLLAVAATTLAFHGKRKEAAVLGITTGIVGAVLGSLQVYALYRDDILQDATETKLQVDAAQLAASKDEPTYLAGVFGRGRA
jgi:uncharacterized membrane protein YdjX (TVP38/TMEM64 family)